MVKIGIVSNFSGAYGSEKMLEILDESLSGFEVVNYINYSIADPSEDRRKIRSPKPCVFNVLSRDKFVISILGVIRWLKWLRRDQINFLVVNIALIPEAVIAGRLLRIPVLLFVRESLVEFGPFFVIYRWFLDVIGVTFVCNSEYILKGFLGCSKHFLVYDCIRNSNNLEELATKTGYSVENQKKIVFLGRISFRKGLDIIIEALEILESKTFETKILLDIFGEVRPGDEQMATDLKIRSAALKNSEVRFCGYAENVISRLPGYRFLLATSVMQESFGLTLLEAMKSRVPVIYNSKIESYCEIVGDSESGLNYDGTSEGLARVLQDMASIGNGHYEKMCHNAYERSQWFTTCRYQTELLGVINAVDNYNQSRS